MVFHLFFNGAMIISSPESPLDVLIHQEAEFSSA
jgi:hypothetical protein